MSLARLLWLFALGVLLAPVAGYAGALVLFPLVVWWLMQSLLLLIGAGIPSDFIGHFFLPGFYGIKWAWPTTCIIFPILGAYWSRFNMLAPLAFAIFGFICGLMTPLAVARIDPQGLAAFGEIYFLIAASGAGAIVGAAFGFALWRINVEHTIQSR